MASFCDCCGKQLGFGEVAGTVKHLGEKLKLCQGCSEDLERVELEVAHGNAEGFQRQANSFQARIRKDTEDTPFCKWWQDYLVRADVKLHGVVRKREQAERQERQKENLLLTTGGSFEGYRVREYLGIVTGEEECYYHEVAGTWNQAMETLKQAAIELGANGILGISFTHSIRELLSAGNVRTLIFIAGTAVLLEPETKPDFSAPHA